MKRLLLLLCLLPSLVLAQESVPRPTAPVTQSGTWTVQPGNTANTTAWKVDGSAVTQPVSGTFWQATQPVSGTLACTESGTWTVQPGNTANTTAWKVDGSAVTQPVSGTFWQATQPISVASIPSHAVTNAGTFAVQATEADGANTTLGAKGDAKSTATDTTAITIMSVLKQISASVQAPPSQAVTNAGTFAVQAASAGDTANGSSDAGNPVKIGGIGHTANPTAVTDAQRVAATFDKLGKQVVVDAIRDLKGVQQTTITSSTAETTVVTAVASTFLDVYGVICTNTSVTTTKVTFKDSTSGTTRFVIECPAAETRGFMITPSAAIPQATVNTNWTATCGTSVASVEITMLYVKNT